MKFRILASKISDCFLETGRSAGCASETFGSLSQFGSIFNAKPILPKSELVASAPGKFRLQPTIEFIVTVLFLGDAMVIFGALCLGFWIQVHAGLIASASNVPVMAPTLYTVWNHLNLFVIATTLILGTFAFMRVYSKQCFMNFSRTAKAILQAGIFWLFVCLAFSFVLEFNRPRLFVVFSFVLGSAGLLLWRFAFYHVMSSESLATNLRQNILFVGWGNEAKQLEQEIRHTPNHSFNIVGYIPSPFCCLNGQPPSNVPVLGEYQQLLAILRQHRPDIVILADLNMDRGTIVGLANACEMEFAQFKIIPSYFQTLASGLRLETVSGVPVLGVSDLPLNRFSNRVFKRIVDIIGATAGLILSIPFIAIFGALVYFESPGPIFYPQERASRRGRVFKMLKIRSMKIGAEVKDHGQLAAMEKPSWWVTQDDPRRLKIGAFMRKFNIDEIPQFWNVLKGDMSLVGPRPEQPESISIFEFQVPHYHARHTCLPGMTGWAQVNGWRGDTSMEQRIRSDIWYVENWSLGLDLRIMILTLGDSLFGAQPNAY